MECNPPVDSATPASTNGLSPCWNQVLAHRPEADGSRQEAAERFIAAGISPEQVWAALVDGGDALYAAASNGPNWTEPFGGPLAVALLAAEVSALAAHLSARAAGVRARAVEELLDEYSAIAVAGQLGVSRQKVYELGRGSDSRPPAIARVPWRSS